MVIPDDAFFILLRETTYNGKSVFVLALYATVVAEKKKTVIRYICRYVLFLILSDGHCHNKRSI